MSFVVVGNGTDDDTAALQLAINSLPAGESLRLRPGTYRITDTLRTQAGGYRAGLSIVGADHGASGEHSTVFLWDGPDDRAALEWWSASARIAGVAIRTARGRHLNAAIDISNPPGVAMTNVSLDRVQVWGRWASGGTIGDGVRFGSSPESTQNVDMMDIRDSYFVNCSRGVHVVPTTGQSKAHSLRRVRFLYQGEIPAGCGVAMESGSFHAESCSFGNLERAVLLSRSTDVISIRGTDSESCKRFLDTSGESGGGGSASAWPVSIESGRFHLDKAAVQTETIPASDRNYVRHRWGGPLRLGGNIWGTSQDNGFQIMADRGCRVYSAGDHYPNTAPFTGTHTLEVHGSTGGHVHSPQPMGVQ